MGSKDHINWLPGLGYLSHHGSNSLSTPRAELETGLNTQAGESEVDEVQYSIVCKDCGKYFWSRSKADSHAALTAHVLWEEFPSSAIEAETSPGLDTADQEDGEDSEQFARSRVPSPEHQALHLDSDGHLRRSLGVSPSPSASALPSNKDLPTQTVLTPNMTATPSQSSSCATLEQPQVTFPHELSDRIFFVVTPSGNRKGPGFIMGLAEAQNAVTFRSGVRTRLESQGEQVGFRKIVARIPWLSVPIFSDTDEDHYHMLMVVRSWPEWHNPNWKASCQIFLTLEDEKEDHVQGDK